MALQPIRFRLESSAPWKSQISKPGFPARRSVTVLTELPRFLNQYKVLNCVCWQPFVKSPTFIKEMPMGNWKITTWRPHEKFWCDKRITTAERRVQLARPHGIITTPTNSTSSFKSFSV